MVDIFIVLEYALLIHFFHKSYIFKRISSLILQSERCVIVQTFN